MAEPAKPSFISRQVVDGRYLFIDLSPPLTDDLRLVAAGREVCRLDYRLARHRFPYHALEFVFAGSAAVSLHNQTHSVSAGGIFHYGPRDAHEIRSQGEQPLVKYFVNFVGRAGEQFVRSGPFAGSPVRRIVQMRWVHDIFDQLLECALHTRPVAEGMGALLLELLLRRLAIDASHADSPASPAMENFTRCRRYIDEHYLHLSSVREAARACELDPAYVARLFGRFGDEPPHRYLTRLKMDHAADLLVRHNVSVQEAARAVGFDDPYHFSRAFKRIYRVAPLHFRAGVGIER